MSIEDAVLEAVRVLPPERQQEVLHFAESLRLKAAEGRPRRPLRGLLKDLGPAPTEEDIAEARREMWGNFPREHLL